MTDSENLKDQIRELQAKLLDAERRACDNMRIASEKARERNEMAGDLKRAMEMSMEMASRAGISISVTTDPQWTKRVPQYEPSEGFSTLHSASALGLYDCISEFKGPSVLKMEIQRIQEKLDTVTKERDAAIQAKEQAEADAAQYQGLAIRQAVKFDERYKCRLCEAWHPNSIEQIRHKSDCLFGKGHPGAAILAIHADQITAKDAEITRLREALTELSEYHGALNRTWDDELKIIHTIARKALEDTK